MGAPLRSLTGQSFIYGFVVASGWKGISDRGLVDAEYSGKGGQRGVVKATSVLVFQYVFCVPFSLAFCNESFNGRLGNLKSFGGFCMLIKTGIPFCLFDL